jgi:uncharacterized delta-60 repeat protein
MSCLRIKSFFISLLGVTVLVMTAPEARAAAGDLDTSFDGNGIAQIDVFRYPQGTGLAVLPDGSIVVAVGSPWANVFGAMRLLPDGTPDETFGLHGRVRIDLDGRASATDLLLQSDGKVVVVGFVRKRMLAARFATDGSFDPTFGGDGKVAVRFPGRSALASSAALTPDGKIVLAGTVSRSRSKHKMVLVRLTARGELDTAFGNDGKVVPPLGSCACSKAEDVAVMPGGSTVVVGQYDQRTATVMVDVAGALDDSFAGDGARLGKLGLRGEVGATTVALDATTGGIVVAGWGWGNTFEPRGFLTRFTIDGALDPSFQDGSVVITSKINVPGSLAIQSDGGIVVGGGNCCGAGSELFFELGRFSTSGDVDASFGTHGSVFFGFDLALYPGWAAAALQADGNIIVTGGREGDRLMMARYLG